ncbi:MAG: NRDE family protein [Acidiphilium sp.]|nr:NRDE family protein [Acidiphilium sp.]MDD4934507.1 NRDE family protein [Acidiphilium sp.]
MCSLILSFCPGLFWPVAIGANRDERLDRPWDAPARHWPERPGIIAGRDRMAGGTWLGLNDHGVVAALLNRTGSLGPAPGKASRGELPLLALDHTTAEAAAICIASLDAGRYRSFNMVIADATGGFLLRGLEHGTPTTRAIEPGITMVTAGDPNDRADPRIDRYLPLFNAAARPDPGSQDWTAWIALLADRTNPGETALNVGPHEGYGTVCASLIGLSTDTARLLFAPGPPDLARFDTVC